MIRVAGAFSGQATTDAHYCLSKRQAQALQSTLRISNAIILPNIGAENRGGWDNSHDQPFRGMQ